MLLVNVVQGGEIELELLCFRGARSELDIECMVALLRDGVAHAASLESEGFAGDGVEARSGGHLTLILQNDRHDCLLADASLAESKGGGTVSFLLSRLLNLQGGKGSLTTDLEHELTHLRFWVAVLHHSLEDTAILLHLSGAETDSDVLVLVGVDRETLRLDIEGKALRFGLGAGVHCEFNRAGDLVGVHDLEALLCALGVLGSDESTEPEDVLSDREDARANNSLRVHRRVQRRDHRLLLKDLIHVLGVNTGVARLRAQLEGDASGHVGGVAVGDVDG